MRGSEYDAPGGDVAEPQRPANKTLLGPSPLTAPTIGSAPNPDATIFVIDDDRALASAMKALLEFEGLRVRTYHSASEFVADYDDRSPGCVVSDVRLPDMSGVDLQNVLSARRFRPPMVLITGHADVPTAVRAMAAGAVDFIEKPFSDHTLLRTVRRALSLDAARRHEIGLAEAISRRRARLTPQERRVFEFLIVGRQNKEIAHLLSISPRTVEKYRAWVMEKMQARNLYDLVRMAGALRALDGRSPTT
jgi:two-component system response regulator FixJ